LVNNRAHYVLSPTSWHMSLIGLMTVTSALITK